jgi:hypothetical protein
MATLLSMSYDVLFGIFSDAPSDLNSLSRVSKGVHDFAEPLLYKNILIIIFSDEEDTLFVTTHLLLRTVLRRPELAKLIQHFSYGGGEDEYADRYTYIAQLIPYGLPKRLRLREKDVQAFLSVVENSNFPFKDKWESASKSLVRAHNPGCLSRAFNISTENVKSITLPNGEWERSPFIRMIFEFALVPSETNPNPSSFQHLESLSASFFLYRTVGLPKITPDVMAFFYLPALRDLSVGFSDTYSLNENTQEYKYNFTWPAERPQPTKIRSLNISVLRDNNLAEVFSLMLIINYY